MKVKTCVLILYVLLAGCVSRGNTLYPVDAYLRGTTGYAIAEYTVTENGQVLDPKIVESQPPGVFDEACLDLVATFQYRPRVVDGTPVAVNGVQNKCTFEIDD